MFSKSKRFFLAFLSAISIISCTSESTKPHASLEQAIDGAYAATLTPSASHSVMSSTHNGVTLWNVEKQGIQFQWTQSQHADNPVFLTHISPDGSFTISAEDQAFAVWNNKTGKSVGYWKTDAPIRDIAISNKGHSLLIGQSDNQTLHISLPSGRRLAFLGHSEKINSVALSQNGRFALTGGNDYVAYFWDTQTGQVIHTFAHTQRVIKVAIDHQDRYLFTADSTQAYIWDLKTGAKISALQFGARHLTFSAVSFSHNGQWIATGSPTRALTLWDRQTGQPKQHWRVTPRKHSRPKGAVVYSVAFSEDNSTLVSASSSGLIEMWQLPNQ